MQTALYISLWAYLFCMPLSEPGQVFGWERKWLYKTLNPDKSELGQAAFMALIGCPKCHAGQIALWFQVWNLYKNGEFSLPFILVAIAGAYALQTWHQIVDKWLNK